MCPSSGCGQLFSCRGVTTETLYRSGMIESIRIWALTHSSGQFKSPSCSARSKSLITKSLINEALAFSRHHAMYWTTKWYPGCFSHRGLNTLYLHAGGVLGMQLRLGREGWVTWHADSCCCSSSARFVESAACTRSTTFCCSRAETRCSALSCRDRHSFVRTHPQLLTA